MPGTEGDAPARVQLFSEVEPPPLAAATPECAVIVTDRNGLITKWSDRAEEVFGFTPHEIVGEPESVLFTAEDRSASALERERVEAVRNGGASGLRWHLHKDGGRVWGDGTLVALSGPDGGCSGFVRVVRDETRARLLDDEVERRDARLVTSDRRKDRFLATLAHELKNPLQAIRMGVALLRESRGSEAEFAEWAGLVEAQVEAVFRIVEDLSDVARVASGKVELRREQVSVRRVMEQAVETVRGVLESRRQRLTTAYPPGDVCLSGDLQRLRQVFVNLLSNSAKYTPEGGGICFAATLEGAGVSFRVWDDGIGISPEMLPRIFDPYVQADAPAEGHTGLGLGLAIVRELVAQHGGTVEARSDGLGRGSEFEVRLPRDGPAVPA